MSWSDDQKTPRFAQHATAKKLTPHPAKAIMDQRWEARRARSVPPAPEPTDSGIQVKTLQPHDLPRLPPPIPLAALEASRRVSPSAPERAPDAAADGGRRTAAPTRASTREPVALLGNPQQALLVVALGATALLLALLYFGGFVQ